MTLYLDIWTNTAYFSLWSGYGDNKSQFSFSISVYLVFFCGWASSHLSLWSTGIRCFVCLFCWISDHDLSQELFTFAFSMTILWTCYYLRYQHFRKRLFGIFSRVFLISYPQDGSCVSCGVQIRNYISTVYAEAILSDGGRSFHIAIKFSGGWISEMMI